MNESNNKNFNWELFNWKFYIDINIDLKITNESKAKEHFKLHGYKEDRLYSFEQANLFYNYDWDKYLRVNIDLVKNKITDVIGAYNHYLNYGKIEGRKIYLKESKNIDLLKDFNLYIYRIFNPDLKKAKIESDQELRHHYITHGKKEKRVSTNAHYLLWKNNDWEKFCSKNNKSDEMEAFYYYISEGDKNKLKIYPLANDSNFNLNFYNQFYNYNLKNINEAIKHYENIKEKKLYSYEHYLIYKIFNWRHFYNSNQKLLDNNYNLKFTSLNNFITYYIYNFKKIKESFNIDINKEFCKILENKDLKKIFFKTDLLSKIINYNIKNFNINNIKELINIENIINNKVNIEVNLINIPKFYNFNQFTHVNNKINFTFVISSFNNEKNIYNNLLSIIYQNNKNWNIIYTNDCSNDKTDVFFQKIIKDFNITGKVKYILNKENKKQSYCKFNSYKLCKNDEIVIILDGDDWLCRNDVLSLLTKYYLKEKCLALYTGYKVYIDNKIDKIVNGSEYPNEIKNAGEYRTYPNWKFTHIKTGFSNLFKNIPSKYFKYNGIWLDRCTDLAEYYSVCEMAKEKVFHLNEICCKLIINILGI